MRLVKALHLGVTFRLSLLTGTTIHTDATVPLVGAEKAKPHLIPITNTRAAGTKIQGSGKDTGRRSRVDSCEAKQISWVIAAS